MVKGILFSVAHSVASLSRNNVSLSPDTPDRTVTSPGAGFIGREYFQRKLLTVSNCSNRDIVPGKTHCFLDFKSNSLVPWTPQTKFHSWSREPNRYLRNETTTPGCTWAVTVSSLESSHLKTNNWTLDKIIITMISVRTWVICADTCCGWDTVMI